MYLTSFSQTSAPLGDGDRIIALPHFSALIALLVGVATGFVEGTTAPTTPTGRAISVMPLFVSSPDNAVSFGMFYVAKNAECFAMIFNNFICQVSKASCVDRHCGQFFVSFRLHQRPSDRQSGAIIASLVGTIFKLCLSNSSPAKQIIDNQHMVSFRFEQVWKRSCQFPISCLQAAP